MSELGRAGAIELGIQLNPRPIERLLAYAESVPHFPTAVKEVRGFVYSQATRRPLHKCTGLTAYAGHYSCVPWYRHILQQALRPMRWSLACFGVQPGRPQQRCTHEQA